MGIAFVIFSKTYYMRRIILSALVLVMAVTSFAQDKVPTADEVLQTAYKQAAKEKKTVLLIFHASWCGWCRKMDQSLNDAAVKPLIDKYYVVTHLTVYETNDKKKDENPGALEFITKKGGADKGLPYWLFLDAKGNTLGNSELPPNGNVGCPAAEAEVNYFIELLKKTSKLTDDELKIIAERFRQNEH